MSDTPEEKKEQPIVKTSSSLVFISHDTRDAEIAEAFSTLLKRVSAGVLKSFRSSDKKGNQGIEYGVEWYPEIIKNIQGATDVVCLLTPNSVDRPWILFEAGMAKGKLNTPILGVALGLPLTKASSGPFAQFQNCSGDEDSLCKLVFQLVDRIPNSEPDEETIKFHVQKFITSIEEIFTKRKESPENESIVEYNENETPKLFEEIKVMFQDLPSRIESRIDPEFRDRKRRRRIHPIMIEELMHLTPNPMIGMLMALGLIRDKMPWLYELGTDTIKTLKSDFSIKEKEKAVMQFEEMVEITTHHPMMEEMFMSNSKEDYILYRELPRMLRKSMQRLINEE
ncbi:toll/interleukin-1 receptor domain-containing protein [Algoriphagus sp. AGSA1]|uniref:toll/interleukin-1 receptor domain-containing protein n=1 Tax=Algoriphagus sp. AGSA1 TaxID=2907213 RepID=UPI001F1D6A56|nr:toll/interleukin-1 receptor domain-containing protein [Algoriphagus sp. AGSA1]MCE7057142.1 toll/interleukin-1 receptor domain-containing protein [Algoriphagus sp. AGSA1]